MNKWWKKKKETVADSVERLLLKLCENTALQNDNNYNVYPYGCPLQKETWYYILENQNN